MSDGTKIEWTDATWNVVNGCSVVSPGCKHCYAMKQAHRFPVRQGLTQKTAGGMVWTGEIRFNEALLDQPLRWKRPRKIFVCAHGDLFHEKVPIEWIAKVFNVMAEAPQHIFQVLTKRPDRLRQIMNGPKHHGLWSHKLWHRSVLPNVWLGTSVEDQQRANERIPLLLDTPAAVRWLSMEPLLGPIDLIHVEDSTVFPGTSVSALTGWGGWDYPRPGPQSGLPSIDWVVLGGESGPGARPMHPDWARSIRNQCREAQVPFLFKQWGEWVPSGEASVDVGRHSMEELRFYPDRNVWDGTMSAAQVALPDTMNRVGKRNAGRLLDGAQHDGYPLP